jgi:hypothetical protein
LGPCGESYRKMTLKRNTELIHCRAMNDADGPGVAKLFYERLFAEEIITLHAIPHALDYAVGELRKRGAPPERWATFIHMGA